MRKAMRSHPRTTALLLLGLVLLVVAVGGTYEMYQTGRWLGAYLVLAIVGGWGIGAIGLGLFAYAFD